MTTTYTDDDMRSALTDDTEWLILTSDEDGRDAAATWLRVAIHGVRGDLKARAEAWAADAATYPPGTDAHRVRLADYKRWRSGALRFETLVVRRMVALGINPNGSQAKPADELERQRRHAARAEAKGNEVRTVLADLASLVEAFLCGDIDTDELSNSLDTLELGNHDGGDAISLRAWLRAKRDQYPTDGAPQ